MYGVYGLQSHQSVSRIWKTNFAYDDLLSSQFSILSDPDTDTAASKNDGRLKSG